MRQPFIYGRPVRNQEFLGRESDLSTVFSRLLNGESTAIVGEPHIGKTSLLLRLSSPVVQKDYMEDDFSKYRFKFIDLHHVSSSYDPPAFWAQALEPLANRPGSVPIARQIKRATEEGYSSRSLDRLFLKLGESGRRLVLLLDEFDRLLVHDRFKDPAFFALLRSLSTQTGGLSMITATRLSLADMNDRGRQFLDTGSPFFNHLIPVELKPFDEDRVNALLDRAGESLSPQERLFARRIAGRHPFLLQAMGAALLEWDHQDRCPRAAEVFYERISSHFDDLWYAMDDRTRTTAVILSLVEMGGSALGQVFSFGEIERVKAFEVELRKLAGRGLAEKIGEGWSFDWEHALLWQGERWTVGALAFTWWVRDVIIAEVRNVPTYSEWLTNKRYHVLLTQEQWDSLNKGAKKAYELSGGAIGTMARAVIGSLMGRV